MTQSQKLVFSSPTSILSWAGTVVGKRFGDAWYVQKGELFYYFGSYAGEYRLVMTSNIDLGDC